MSPNVSGSTISGAGGASASAPGTIIRVALAIESAVTIAGGGYFMFFPRHYLLRTMEAAASQVTTTAIQAAQQFGAVNILIGAAVAFWIANTRNAIETRQTLYAFLLLFEVLYIPLLLWQAVMNEGGMPRKSLLATAGQFVPFVVWRVFTLGWKPEWFGRYEAGRKVE